MVNLRRKFKPTEMIFVWAWLLGFIACLASAGFIILASNCDYPTSPYYGNGFGQPMLLVYILGTVAFIEVEALMIMMAAGVSFMVIYGFAPILSIFCELIVMVPKVANLVYPDGHRENPAEDLEFWKWEFKKKYPGATIEYPEGFCPYKYYLN